jgi:predicted nucleic acid-binding protein
MWSSYKGQTIYLDSNIVIYAVEKNHSWMRATQTLLEQIDSGHFDAMTSELVLAEVLAAPMAVKNHRLVQAYGELFAADSGLRLLPVNRFVLKLAADIRGQLKLKLADAIHVATARLARCDYFLTQDERLGRVLAGQPKWLKLSEIT